MISKSFMNVNVEECGFRRRRENAPKKSVVAGEGKEIEIGLRSLRNWRNGKIRSKNKDSLELWTSMRQNLANF